MHAAINSDPTKPVRRVYNECIVIDSSDDSEEVMEIIPQFSEVRSSLARKKRKYFPAIPRRVQDVIIHREWKKTWNGKEFLVHQDSGWGLLIFLSRVCAVKLQQCSDVYIDGTFKTCPLPYKQLVTLHGKYGDRVIPFAFCFLRSKETSLYREMIQQLKQHVARLSGNNFIPDRVICDFEISLISAIQAEFPNTTVRGCYFHFCQSLWRKVQQLGLASEYRQNRSVKKVIRKIMSLGYLPTAVVRMKFNLIFVSRSVARLMVNVPGLRDFIDYFNMNYINGIFPPALWNVYDRDVDFRTNNHVEGLLVNVQFTNISVAVIF